MSLTSKFIVGEAWTSWFMTIENSRSPSHHYRYSEEQHTWNFHSNYDTSTASWANNARTSIFIPWVVPRDTVSDYCDYNKMEEDALVLGNKTYSLLAPLMIGGNDQSESSATTETAIGILCACITLSVILLFLWKVGPHQIQMNSKIQTIRMDL